MFLRLDGLVITSAGPYMKRDGKGVRGRKGCQIDLLIQARRTICVVEIKCRCEIGRVKPFRQTADNLWLAVKWFRKAADQGNAEAQYELGELYNDGFNLIGGTVNENEAVKWYRKAAEQGHAESQYKLGECYRYGWGWRRTRWGR